jgi:8-oxo-dGTP pyrophosphatase MutT (NUDIX family)
MDAAVLPPLPPPLISGRWSALADARRCAVPRTPFLIDGRPVGSVAEAHLDALARWPAAFERNAQGLHLRTAPDGRNALLAQVNAALRADGLVRAWRDETYAIVAAPGQPPLALIERASSRFWGTLTFGAHCNGWVAGSDGRPAQLWVARRAWAKATDPGKLDNLIGGGVPHGQSPFETLVREGHEEAGLDAATVRRAVPGSVIALACDIAEGFMQEHLHAFDLQLAPDVVPINQDGEVAELTLRPVADALALAAAGEMTVDAALVTLDFALRHGLVGTAEAQALHGAMRPLLHVPR